MFAEEQAKQAKWQAEQEYKRRRDIPMDTNCCNEAQISSAGMLRPQTPEEVIDFLFTFHDNPDKTPHYVEIREAAKAFAKVLCRHVPQCGDRLTAVQKIREAVMFANAGVALDGRGL